MTEHDELVTCRVVREKHEIESAILKSENKRFRDALESIRYAGQDYFDISAATQDGLIEHIIGLKEMARQALTREPEKGSV